MIKELPKSTGTVLGFTVSGDVTKDDYQILVPEVEKAVDAHGSVALLFDLSELHHEKLSAWSSDFAFGKDYHDKITRMAIVGLGRFGAATLKMFDGWYAQDVEYFDSTKIDDAWKWVADK